MTREEMLKKLHNITFRARLTALSSEGCIEVDIITGDGTLYNWMGYDDFEWNAYLLNSIDKNQWEIILSHLSDGVLTETDIEGTVLHKIIENRKNTDKSDYSPIFSSLNAFPKECPQEFYCFIDVDSNLHFYLEKEMLAKALKEQFSNQVEKWDKMSDEALTEWVSTYEDYDDIPLSEFAE